MRRFLLPAALVAIAALAILLLVTDPPRGPASQERSPTGERRSVLPESGALGPEVADPSAASIPPGLDRAAAAVPAAAPEPRFGTPRTEGSGLLARVLDEGSRNPLAGAEVLVADLREQDRIRVQRLLLETRDGVIRVPAGEVASDLW